MLALETPHTAFPPAGKLVSVAALKPLTELKIGDLGGFELEHCYEDLLAYLKIMVDAVPADPPAGRGQYAKHCEAILVQGRIEAP